MRKVVLAIVSTSERAESLAARFTSAGFLPGRISVLLPDARRGQAFVHEQHTELAEGALKGVVAGGLLGSLVGVLGATVAGLGALVVAGPLLASLSGAAVFATLLGVVGGLRGRATPRYEARMYEGRLRDGNLLFSVHLETHDEQRQALEILRAFGARDVSVQGDLTPEPRAPAARRRSRAEPRDASRDTASSATP